MRLGELKASVASLAILLASTMAASTAADAQSSVPVSSRAPVQMGRPLTPAQLAEILKVATPMEKSLARKPTVLSESGLPVTLKDIALPVIKPGEHGPSDNDVTGLPVPNKDDTVSPRNYGTGNLSTVYHYSDSLIDTKLRKTYPTRATGYFLFQQGGSWHYCSGSLIAKSLVLVAGHCVYNKGVGWNTAGYFYPSASNMNSGTPITPYGSASAYTYWTWTAWASSGALDQGNDTGIVVLNTRDGDPRKTWEMGRFTGSYGVCLKNCLQPYWSLTQLGYPSNYYDGNYMTKGEHLYVSDSRDYVWGSGMRGGSSGGPQVANLGSLIDSAANLGQWSYRNIVFATTSWGYDDSQYKIQGGSPLSGPGNTLNFGDLYNAACTDSKYLHGDKSC